MGPACWRYGQLLAWPQACCARDQVEQEWQLAADSWQRQGSCAAGMPPHSGRPDHAIGECQAVKLFDVRKLAEVQSFKGHNCYITGTRNPRAMVSARAHTMRALSCQLAPV